MHADKCMRRYIVHIYYTRRYVHCTSKIEFFSLYKILVNKCNVVKKIVKNFTN
jgi:hypothetical protein